MNGGRPVRFDFGEGFFLDSGDDYFIALGSGCIEHKKRKAAIARDQTDALETCQNGTPANCPMSTKSENT